VPYTGYGYSVPYAAPYGAAPTREQEVETLQRQAESFKDALAEIQKRIDELEPKAQKK
jgi:prefoldin subunit 5